MRFARVVVASLAVAGTVAGGCAHERLPWPPPASEIARINDASREEAGWLRVEYVEPTATRADVKVVKPIRIESIDDDEIVFRTKAGETEAVPSLLVRAVTVKERNRGGLVGALVGAGADAALVGGWWLLVNNPRGEGNCLLYCDATTIGVGIIISAAVGMVFGYAIGSRRTFHFDRSDRAP